MEVTVEKEESVVLVDNGDVDGIEDSGVLFVELETIKFSVVDPDVLVVDVEDVVMEDEDVVGPSVCPESVVIIDGLDVCEVLSDIENVELSGEVVPVELDELTMFVDVILSVVASVAWEVDADTTEAEIIANVTMKNKCHRINFI